ncbi:MAG TPA: MBL fold metallo-hydrolase [Jiangellaceae bacterium]|jgi:glyoxylase-like metal-dependent hydrolase (beta-lactamase superfamily II)|nr:MBL fold metallo-hydrolase [Jiangellaceae bacterium]
MESPNRSLTIGAAQVTAVLDLVGEFPASLARAFPDVEQTAWKRYRRRYPETFSGMDRWRLSIWCFLVHARSRLILVDTGVGASGTPGADWIGSPGGLPQELANAGVDPDLIDVVVLTHLHLDHVGWNLVWEEDQPRPRFRNARYLVQRADWELFADQADDNDSEAFEYCVRPLETLGMLDVLDGDRVLDGELTVLHTPGHTPGSQSLLVHSGDDAVLLWGDVANHPAQIDEPAWCSVGDLQPEQAPSTRRRLLDRVVAEQMWLGPAHFPEPFGTVASEEGGRRWLPRG